MTGRLVGDTAGTMGAETTVQAGLGVQTSGAGSRWGDACWQLYDETGYFRLSDKTAASFAPLKRAYLDTGRRLEETPDVGCHVVWPREDGTLLAALSIPACDKNSNPSRPAPLPGCATLAPPRRFVDCSRGASRADLCIPLPHRPDPSLGRSPK